MLGTYITTTYSFSTMTDILALVWITYGFLYFTIGGAYEGLSKKTDPIDARNEKLLKLTDVMDESKKLDFG
jgi:hypothetical protein